MDISDLGWNSLVTPFADISSLCCPRPQISITRNMSRSWQNHVIIRNRSFNDTPTFWTPIPSKSHPGPNVKPQNIEFPKMQSQLSFPKCSDAFHLLVHGILRSLGWLRQLLVFLHVPVRVSPELARYSIFGFCLLSQEEELEREQPTFLSQSRPTPGSEGLPWVWGSWKARSRCVSSHGGCRPSSCRRLRRPGLHRAG